MSTITLPPPLPYLPAASLLTAEQFVVQYDGQHAELVAGLVRELPMPNSIHGKICVRLARFLDEFADQHDLGHVLGSDTSIKIRSNPDTVYGPDICFYTYERLPKDGLTTNLLTLIPNMVIEVRSPSDRWAEIVQKVGNYQGAGVQVVVVVDPLNRTVMVFHDDMPQTLTAEHALTIPELLPGFVLPLAKLFPARMVHEPPQEDA